MMMQVVVAGALFANSVAGFTRTARYESTTSSSSSTANSCVNYNPLLKGSEAEFNYTRCPNLEPPHLLIQTGEDHTYDPKLVDWRALIKSIQWLAGKEPRYCNFVIRAHFHDAGAVTPSHEGADGSHSIDKYEFLQPENAYDAFGFFVRVVNSELARWFGASYADLLNVGAATCVESLGGVVPIVPECAGTPYALKVGKLDAKFDFSLAAASRVHNLPAPFHEAPKWLSFWMKFVNDQAATGHKFTVGESLALMGSHTLIDNQVCTTSGESKDVKYIGDFYDQCTGKRKMFEWTNDYFKDVTSGQCQPRNFRPGVAGWYVTTMDGSKGRQPNEQEHKNLAPCAWKTSGGAQLGNNLQCVTVHGASELGIGAVPEDQDFRFVDWYPDEHRSSCCGYHCQKCPGGLSKDAEPYFCANDSPAGTGFWPYTWQDCDLKRAAGASGTEVAVKAYCEQNHIDCSSWASHRELMTHLQKAAEAYSRFSHATNGNTQWQKEYAAAHCKLNHLGATYSQAANGGRGVELTQAMMDECKHPSFRGCDSDPNTTGILRRSTYKHCTGATDPLYLGELISKKNCQSCSDALIAGPQVPETGAIVPGSTYEVDGVEIIVAHPDGTTPGK